MVNSAHLRPSYALDVVLSQYSKEIVNGDWAHMGVHPRIGSEHDIHVSRVGGAVSWPHDLAILHVLCLVALLVIVVIFSSRAFWLEIVKPPRGNSVIG